MLERRHDLIIKETLTLSFDHPILEIWLRLSTHTSRSLAARNRSHAPPDGRASRAIVQGIARGCEIVTLHVMEQHAMVVLDLDVCVGRQSG